LPVFLEIGLTGWNRFKVLIRVRGLAVIIRFGYVEMIKCLMIKLFSYAGYPLVQYFAPFMVTYSAYG
jgi:hypothetical protein